MKNTITQLKAFLCFVVLAMFSYNLSTAQSWDYVNFTEGSGKTINNACIDDSDNVYAYGYDAGYTRVMRRFNSAGTLQWTKDVTSQIDYSNDNTMAGGVGGIEYGGSKVYLVGNKSNKGIILQSGTASGDPVTTWEQLSGSTSTIGGIKLKNGHLYVVGIFGGLSSGSTTVTFDGSTTLTGAYKSAFIAKYTYPSKSLVWAKKIHASNITNAVNVDVDNSDNVYVTGHFRGSATFYNGSTPHTFTSGSSWTADTYLAKFDSNGNFNTTYGLKTDATSDSYNWRSFDVEVNDTNDAVYWSEDTRVRAYNKNGSGSFLWSRDLAAKPYSLETNSCGDLYVTGATGTPVSKTVEKAPCGYNYFAASLDNTGGTSVWISNSTSCVSAGNEALVDSNNKEILVGYYSQAGGSGPLNIDTSYASTTSNGYYIGRYTDDPVNSCCKATLEVGKSKVICDGDPWPVLDITGQIPNIVSINWYLNGNPFPQPVNAETITTFAAGTYSVVVVYDNGCTLTDAMTLVVNDCPAECEVTPKFDVKIKACSASFSNNSYASGGTTIVGYLWDFGDGTTSTEVNPTHTYPIGGSHIVTLSVYGINADGDCCVKQIQRKVYINISCLPKCGVYPKFQVSNAGNGVALFESVSTTNGFTTIVGYEWTLNGTVVSNNQYFAQPFSGGTLCLTVYGLTAKGECCSETVCKDFKSTKEEEALEDKFKVYPNPTQNDINFDFSTLDNARSLKEISVIDVNGRVLLAKETNMAKYRVETKDWPTGLYLCKVTIDGITTTKKVIKN